MTEDVANLIYLVHAQVAHAVDPQPAYGVELVDGILAQLENFSGVQGGAVEVDGRGGAAHARDVAAVEVTAACANVEHRADRAEIDRRQCLVGIAQGRRHGELTGLDPLSCLAE